MSQMQMAMQDDIPESVWRAIHLDLCPLTERSDIAWVREHNARMRAERDLVCQFLVYLFEHVYQKKSKGLVRLSLSQYNSLDPSLKAYFPELKRDQFNFIWVSVQNKNPLRIAALLLPFKFADQAGAHLTKWASQDSARAHAVLKQPYLQSLLPEMAAAKKKEDNALYVISAVLTTTFAVLCAVGAILFTGGAAGVIALSLVSIALASLSVNLNSLLATPVKDKAKKYKPVSVVAEPQAQDDRAIQAQLAAQPVVIPTEEEITKVTVSADSAQEPNLIRVPSFLLERSKNSGSPSLFRSEFGESSEKEPLIKPKK